MRSLTPEEHARAVELDHWRQHPEYGVIVRRLMRDNGAKNTAEFVEIAPDAAKLALDTVSAFLELEEEDEGLQFSLQPPEDDDDPPPAV